MAKAASLAGVSWAQMKVILIATASNPSSGRRFTTKMQSDWAVIELLGPMVDRMPGGASSQSLNAASVL